jgi:hypothetical protein
MSQQQAAQLTVDPGSDELRPVVELFNALTGKRPSPATVWRICTRGNKRAGKLPALKVLGAWHSTRPTLLQWLQAGADRSVRGVEGRSTKRVASTEKRLREAGLIGPILAKHNTPAAERLEGEGA